MFQVSSVIGNWDKEEQLGKELNSSTGALTCGAKCFKCKEEIPEELYGPILSQSDLSAKRQYNFITQQCSTGPMSVSVCVQGIHTKTSCPGKGNGHQLVCLGGNKLPAHQFNQIIHTSLNSSSEATGDQSVCGALS